MELGAQQPQIYEESKAQMNRMVQRSRMQEEPDWNGLTSRQLMLLRGAIDTRMKVCSGKNQNPLLEAAVFFTLESLLLFGVFT